MSAPTASVVVLSAPDTCSDVRTQTTTVKLDDEPRGVFAERFLYNVTFTEVALDLLQRELLQCWNVILAGVSSSTWWRIICHNLVGQPVDGLR